MQGPSPSSSDRAAPPMDWALDAASLLEWADSREPWITVDALRAAGRIRLWISAATLSSLDALTGPSADRARTRLAGEVGNGWRPFTADAGSALDAVVSAKPAWSLRMAHVGFLRIAPGGRFITRDSDALALLPGTLVPEAALAEISSGAAAKAAAEVIPMLDLKEEYRLNQPRLDRALLGVAATARYILGPQVAEFETSLAGYLGCAHAIGVSSGTEALLLALRALAQVRLGRERFAAGEYVLTTPFTFQATGTAILRAGAMPYFCDIDPRTGNLDPVAVRRALENPPGKVVGLIPVHLFGRPCPMDELLSLAKTHGLFVLEDVAQALGAAWKGRRLGALGDIAAFSFFPSKNLGGFGDAGAVTTSDPALAEAVALLMNHGGVAKGRFDRLGYNARLDTMQAAVLLAKLPGIDAANRARRDVARAYLDALGGIAGLTMPDWPGEDPGSHVIHQFTLRTARRDALQAHLAKAGIASMIYYPHPLHTMPVFEGRCAVGEDPQGAGLPASEAASREVLSLPIGPTQGAVTTQAVIAAVKDFFRG